jgi:CHAD domain-containing protein
MSERDPHPSALAKASTTRLAAASPRLAPQHAADVRLKREMSVANALTATLAECTRHIRANIAGARRGQDPESLHQLRIGIRRLRAALSAYRNAIVAAERHAVGRALRQFEHKLGPARNWDVLIGKLDETAQEDAWQRQGFAGVIELAKTRRSAAHGQLVRAIGHLPISELLRRAQQLAAGRGAEPALGAPIRDFAIRELDARDRRARRMGRRIGSLNAEKLHRLRICVKKLRYASEFFVGLWPKAATKDYAEALKGLQEELGDMQDAATAAQLMAGIRKERRDALQHSVKQAQRWVKASRKRARRRIVRRWRDFKVAARFWRPS